MKLRLYGFKRGFIHLVQTFSSGTFATVLVNTTSSKYFENGCGVRQGARFRLPWSFCTLNQCCSIYTARQGISGCAFHAVRSHATSSHCERLYRNFTESARHGRIYWCSEDYSDAVGLSLNVSKTEALPFRPRSTLRRAAFIAQGYHVAGFNECTRYSGIRRNPFQVVTGSEHASRPHLRSDANQVPTVAHIAVHVGTGHGSHSVHDSSTFGSPEAPDRALHLFTITCRLY